MRIVLYVSRVIAAAALAFSPKTLRAQNLPPLIVPRPPDPACQNALAAAAAVTAKASPDSLTTLLIEVSPCHPEFGRALGFLMRAVSTTGTLEQVVLPFTYATVLFDSASFAAARDVAATGASSEIARVFSLMTLFHYLDREAEPRYVDFINHVRGAWSCSIQRYSDQVKAVDYTPLPNDVISESRAVAVAIQNQTGVSAALQSASYCVLEGWRKANALPSNAHWPFTRASLSVDHVCGNRFRLRNQHAMEITLQWQVGGLPRRAVLLPRSTPQSAGERLLDAGIPGTLSVFLDGELIFSQANGGNPCF